jgi:hypothetical protein
LQVSCPGIEGLRNSAGSGILRIGESITVALPVLLTLRVRPPLQPHAEREEYVPKCDAY